jgi:hypothetical protein
MARLGLVTCTINPGVAMRKAGQYAPGFQERGTYVPCFPGYDYDYDYRPP